jgi:CubicO group peptidase (beta-lactamase class C family)
MKTVRILIALCAFAWLLAYVVPFEHPLPRSPARQLEINRQQYGIAGQALLVARDGRVLFRGVDGEADVDTHERVTAEHIFPVYSLSKLFVSVLVMQLVEQGTVDLDRPASVYVTGLPASWQAIAVRDFLDHTSGVPEYFDTAVPLSPATVFPDSAQAAFASLADRPLTFATGTETRYTQTNYLVLGALLEAHYGKPYTQVAEERIVRRLGLRHTWLGTAVLPERGVVTSYLGKDGRLERDVVVTWPDYAMAHAGLYMTLDDLAVFLRAVTSGELVGKATLARLWQPRTLAGGERGWFAAGWEYGESGAQRYVGHDGGARVRVRIVFGQSLDDGVQTVIYLTNGSASNVWTRKLVDSVISAAP